MRMRTRFSGEKIEEGQCNSKFILFCLTFLLFLFFFLVFLY